MKIKDILTQIETYNDRKLNLLGIDQIHKALKDRKPLKKESDRKSITIDGRKLIFSNSAFQDISAILSLEMENEDHYLRNAKLKDPKDDK